MVASQICFVIDVTHGMGDSWLLFRRACYLLAQSCIQQQSATEQPPLHEQKNEFAIVLVRGHAPMSEWMCLASDFTTDLKRFARWLRELSCADGLVGGAAMLEAVHQQQITRRAANVMMPTLTVTHSPLSTVPLQALAATHGVAWREDAQRHMILICREPPQPLSHSCAEQVISDTLSRLAPRLNPTHSAPTRPAH
jgi:hypothetical protein